MGCHWPQQDEHRFLLDHFMRYHAWVPCILQLTSTPGTNQMSIQNSSKAAQQPLVQSLWPQRWPTWWSKCCAQPYIVIKEGCCTGTWSPRTFSSQVGSIRVTSSLQWVRVSSRRLTSKLFYQRATIREPVSTIKVLFNPGLLRQNAYQRARAYWLPELFLNLKTDQILNKTHFSISLLCQFSKQWVRLWCQVLVNHRLKMFIKIKMTRVWLQGVDGEDLKLIDFGFAVQEMGDVEWWNEHTIDTVRMWCMQWYNWVCRKWALINQLSV